MFSFNEEGSINVFHHSQKGLSFQVGHCLEKCNVQGSFPGNFWWAKQFPNSKLVTFSSFPGGFKERQGVSRKFTSAVQGQNLEHLGNS